MRRRREIAQPAPRIALVDGRCGEHDRGLESRAGTVLDHARYGGARDRDQREIDRLADAADARKRLAPEHPAMVWIDRVQLALEFAVEEVLVDDPAEGSWAFGRPDHRNRLWREQRPQVVMQRHRAAPGGGGG